MPPGCDSVNVEGYACPVKTSVLMTVYGGDDAAQFALALASIVDQRRPADRIVLVADGPLSDGHEQVISSVISRGAPIERVSLEENSGLVAALNAGLPHCESELILRMDADDYALPERIERQVAFMDAHPEVGVLGSAIEEFSSDHQRPERVKRMPLDHASIMRTLPFRNPINHPTVCMRRVVLPAGGYPDLRYVEDYFLWAQLAARGVMFANLEAPLLRYRFSNATVKRRGGWQNFRSEMKLRLWMQRHDLMTAPGVLGVGLVQFIVRFSPAFLQKLLWRLTREGRASSPEQHVS